MTQKKKQPIPLELPTREKAEGLPKTVFTQSQRVPFLLTLLQQRAQFEQQRGSFQQSFESQRERMRKDYISKIQQKRDSRVLVYYSHGLLDFNEIDMFNELFFRINKIPRLDLYLFSNGGIIDAAYKIVRLCREHCTENLGVIIPYRAKSAATLIALGADDVIMGPASELGPIDPMVQTKDLMGRDVLIPARSVKKGIEYVESRIEEDPERALLFIPLIEKIDLAMIGAYDLAMESSVQYVEELLRENRHPEAQKNASEKAIKLTTQYFSHGFVIDRNVTKDELGLKVLFSEEDEELWEYIWNLHKIYDMQIKDSHGRIRAFFETVDFALISKRQSQQQSEMLPSVPSNIPLLGEKK